MDARGSFVYLRRQEDMSIFNAKACVTAAQSVCQISFSGPNYQTITATGFRVGGKPYIMTTAHTVSNIKRHSYQILGSQHQSHEALSRSTVNARFDVHAEHRQIKPNNKFFFKPIVHFYDEEIDIAVLELEDPNGSLPKPLTYFEEIPGLESFHLVGFPETESMKVDNVTTVIDINNSRTKENIASAKMASITQISRDYEYPPYNILNNPHRVLFRCTLSKGAGGSPGIVARADGSPAVVTMLLCGYPDWFYDPSVPQYIRNMWPEHYCMEQGAKMRSVYEKMKRANPSLCDEIFNTSNH